MNWLKTRTIRSAVMNAAKLAVYAAMMTTVKNHQDPETKTGQDLRQSSSVGFLPDTILPAGDLGAMSLDCCIIELRANQKLLVMENLFWILLPVAKGWSSITHSLGENLRVVIKSTKASSLYVV